MTGETTTETIDDMFNPRFLVLSLGNQAPYLETLHSAGHMALNAVQKLTSTTQPSFSSQRIGKKAAQTSNGSKYIMAQSPTQMNVSGPWVAKAWKETLAESGAKPNELGLVIVHDDLEEDVGVVKIRKWDRSHRGHNGLKSVNANLQRNNYPGSHWAKISVGIGRPEARDPDTVSRFVLKPMSKFQKEELGRKAGPGVIAALQQIEEEWRKEAETAAAKAAKL